MQKYAFLLILLASLVACKPSQRIKKQPNPPKISQDTVPSRFVPDDFSSLVEIETSAGTMKAELFFHTPNHRENFIKLSKQEFYNGTLFHRVIKGFMAQAGDPQSRNAKPNSRLGGGGPGYELDNEINSNYFHIKGALCAARLPDEANPSKKSSGSQFYIVDGRPIESSVLDQNERKHNIIYSPEQRKLYQQLGGAPQLDMEYTVFGRIYEGLEIIDQICANPTDNADRPSKDIKIIKIKVIKE